jgi:hypothetical protein
MASLMESILHQLEENEAFHDGLANRLMLVESGLVGAQFGIISCSIHKKYQRRCALWHGSVAPNYGRSLPNLRPVEWKPAP